MSAVLKPITLMPIARPRFDNTHIDRELRWIHTNAATLARYWHELAGGEKTEASGADFNLWLRCQYEIEVIRQARLPLKQQLEEEA